MSTMPMPPDLSPLAQRKLRQRRDALLRANEVRCRNAVTLAAVKAGDGPTMAAAILRKPTSEQQSMQACTLLLAISGIGRWRIRELLKRARIDSATTRLRNLSERQRESLAYLLDTGGWRR